jgi:hypothetical protein
VLVVAGRRPVKQDGLGLEERQQSVYSAFAAYAGLLETAVPHVEVRLEPVVPDDAGPHPPGDLAGPLDMVGEHGAVQTVDGVVGDPHRVVLVLGRDDGQHRAEDLLLRDHRLVVHVAEHGRLHVPREVDLLGVRVDHVGRRCHPLAADEESICVADRHVDVVRQGHLGALSIVVPGACWAEDTVVTLRLGA